ncbi:MAG: hypothetical protein Q4D82_01755 [Neisseria sp.]|nr:hypothetical protein [Neisseria sp.]
MKKLLAALLLAPVFARAEPAAEHTPRSESPPSTTENGLSETPSESPDFSDGIPYPTTDLSGQVERLNVEILRLGNLVKQLQQRVQQLEQRNTPKQPVTRKPLNGSKRSSPQIAEIVVPDELMPSEQTAKPPLEQAQDDYRQGRYRNVIQTLRPFESGGNGSETDRRSMLLLMQAHQKLNNCQSVIHIGKRHALRFRNSPSAAEALFAVGHCQWKIQQKDIARDTWRKLVQQYPGSQAAKRAAAQLK